MKRFRGALSRSSRGPNSKEWDGSSAAFLSIGTTTAGAWLIDPVQAIDDYESPTVIRCIVSFAARLTAAPAAGNGYVFGFGIYVATGDEDDVTVPTLLWDPVGDEQSDWIYRTASPVLPGTPVGTLYDNGGADVAIQSLAKRKIPRGAGLIAVAGGLGLTAAGTVDMAVNVRALIISG